MPAIRRADATWSGDLSTGSGKVSAMTSNAFKELPVSWTARTESAEGRTSPEELLAAAHAGCLATSVAGELTRAGTPPERIDVTANIVMDEVEGRGHQIVESQVRVRVRVSGIEEDAFRRVVEEADEGCPFSNLIKASAKVSIDAELEG